MKRLVTFFLISCSVLLLSCKPAKKTNTVQGKWKPVTVALKNMSENEKHGLLTHLTLEFTANGNFVNTIKEQKITGTYVYDEKTNSLTIDTHDSKESTQEFTISWENNMMVMTNEEGTVKLKKH